MPWNEASREKSLSLFIHMMWIYTQLYNESIPPLKQIKNILKQNLSLILLVVPYYLSFHDRKEIVLWGKRKQTLFWGSALHSIFPLLRSCVLCFVYFFSFLPFLCCWKASSHLISHWKIRSPICEYMDIHTHEWKIFLLIVHISSTNVKLIGVCVEMIYWSTDKRRLILILSAQCLLEKLSNVI